ncbi:hypothetical protein [Streptomyces sp. IMTB 2501]|uniref:hypothetical protein n=1 Tax=Streptomyces sp. IMTB 2501 TaxID=1776340 RepID=UPI0011800C5A|nr:hypothetical protein [Streptomyces sp. IMTB 2501]
MAIAIATPVLLAAIGMTGASAATSQKPTTGGSIAHPDPTAGSKGAEAKRPDRPHGVAKPAANEEAEPEEGLLGTITGELFDRVAPAAR